VKTAKLLHSSFLVLHSDFLNFVIIIMENPVIIFGAGSLGAMALDIFNRNEVVVYAFLDDNDKLHNTEIGEVVVMGATDDEGFTKLIGKKCEAFVALEETSLRENVVEMLHNRRSVQPINAIHDTAVVSAMADIEHGNLIAARVVINARAKVGSHNVIQTGVIIDADAQIDDFVQIGSGSIIGSSVKIGEKAFIGAGVTVVSGVTIGKKARVGAGSVVVENVAAGATVFGNPAKKV
jgi:sugar O-acyltransferase (sialic acid O-acetyltransferase NeuD family)